MLRKLACAMFVMVVGVAVVAAEEYTGAITKVDGDKVTVQKYKKGEKGKKGEKDGDPVVLTAAKDLKVVKGKFDKEAKKLVAGDPIDGGLKAEVFSKIGDDGVMARITSEGTTVSEILVIGGKKKKKDAN